MRRENWISNEVQIINPALNTINEEPNLVEEGSKHCAKPAQNRWHPASSKLPLLRTDFPPNE